MLIIHHNDMDGRLAAAIAGHIHVTEPCEFVETDYHEPPPWDKIDDHEDIWILDFSYSPKGMDRIYNTTDNMVWIDHHITAIERQAKFDAEINSGLSGPGYDGIREVGKCAARLTWDYVQALLPHSAQESYKPQPAPKVVQYVEDYDLWKFEMPETMKFHFGLLAGNTAPPGPLWRQLIGSVENTEFLYAILVAGKTVMEYQRQEIAPRIYENSWVEQHNGFNVMMVNWPRNPFAVDEAAEFYRHLGKPIHAIVSYSQLGLKLDWKVSFYSKDERIEANVVAELNGGGGHKGAAGWITEMDPDEFDWPPALKLVPDEPEPEQSPEAT